MEIRTFIKKAVEGGWKKKYHPFSYEESPYLEILILDPLVWQAVGRVERWNTLYGIPVWIDLPNGETEEAGWRLKMHGLIDHVADGETIESYIRTL